MKQKLLLMCIFLQLFAINSLGESVTIVKKSATEYISSYFESTSKYWVTELKIVGEMNGNDFLFIREIATSANGGNLTKLDLSEATFVDVDELEKVFEGIQTNKTHSSSSIYDGLKHNYHYVYMKYLGNDLYDTYYLGYHIVWKDVYPGYSQYKITEIKKLDINNICGYSFYGCDKLTSIILPPNTTGIGTNAFKDCKNLQGIDIPEGVEFIESSAFSGCTFLKNINFPPSLSSIGSSAFSDCGHLETLDLSFVKRIDSYSFKNCTNLTKVKLCNEIETVSFGVFDQCKNLSDINIPNSTKTIDTYAFRDCGLKEVIIPEKVTKIGGNAFDGCPLKTVFALSKIPCTCGTKPFFQSGTGKTLYVPKGCVERYRLTPGWEEFETILEINEGDILPQCPTPVVAYIDGAINFTSSLPSANYHYTISTSDVKSGITNSSVPLSEYYNINAYTSLDGYRDSETINVKLFWINGSLNDPTNINNLPKRPLFSSCKNGHIQLSGLNDNEEVIIYSLNGIELHREIARNGIVNYYSKEKIILIRIADCTIKLINP